MAISFEHTIDVSRARDRVFSVLDDFASTPKWLSRCTGIEMRR